MHVALQSSRNQGTELSSSTKIPQLSVVVFLSPLYSNPDKLQKKKPTGPKQSAAPYNLRSEWARIASGAVHSYDGPTYD